MLSTTDFNDLKEKYLEMILSGTQESGGLPPHISLFGNNIDDNEKAIIHIPIDSKFMESEEGKEKFVSIIMPAISAEVNEKWNIYAVAWASEAWLREASTNTPIPENYKDLPITKEVIIVNIESVEKSSCIMYEILRNGHKVTKDGDLIDTVELIPMNKTEQIQSAAGRFTGLIKLFVKA